ncbi:MAG: hypothetical protein AAF633_10100 [Chloroflexota bacterium]
MFNQPLSHTRIGVQIAPNDPFWVQVNETLRQTLDDNYISIEIENRAWHLTDAQLVCPASHSI